MAAGARERQRRTIGIVTARFKERLGFVVPTRNRRVDLWRMLESIRSGADHPHQIIVVDGGDEGQTVEDVTGAFADLAVEYVRVFPPSLARQRNAGMARLAPTLTLAGYLDDDLVLESQAITAMLEFWEQAGANVGGAAFNITNVEPPYATRFKQLFLLEDRGRGVVRRSGYHSMICPVERTTYTDWLFGGATVWRRRIVDEFPYDEWFTGTGFLEDVDYSFTVGRRYRLAVVADARLEHLSPPIRADRQYLVGQWQVINRMYFVKKHRELSPALCLWALVGQAIVNATKACVRGDRASWDRLCGNLAGFLSLSNGRLEQVGGIMK
jgi:glycosyltransferase involved in cell wall biosynthesis